MAISSFCALHASVLANLRIPYAMARGDVLQGAGGCIAEVARAVKTIVAQAAWASVLAVSRTYDTLTDSVIFASWLLYGLTAATIFVFRKRMPDAVRPYRAWGYPILPVLFLIVTAFLIVNTFIATPAQAVMGARAPFYWYWSRALKAELIEFVLHEGDTGRYRRLPLRVVPRTSASLPVTNCSIWTGRLRKATAYGNKVIQDKRLQSRPSGIRS